MKPNEEKVNYNKGANRMSRIKKILTGILALGLVIFLTACGNDGDVEGESSSEGSKGTVGIAMPTQSEQRWNDDGANLVAELEELGYETILQFGEDDVQNQVSQVEKMITRGVDYLVIASIDGSALTDVLQTAGEQDIKVIAYDRLLMNSDHVDYYVTFDNFGVGVIGAEYIEEELGLADGEGPYNIELFGGSPDDNNAVINYDGYMSVFQQYIDNGQLVVPSGQTDFNQIATLRWDAATAQERMDNLISAHYTDTQIDAIFSPYDPISLSIIASLKGIGYGTEEMPLPVITGQDATIPSVKSIIAGEQDSTIFKDTRLLGESTAMVIEALENGEEPEVDDTETYDNGNKVVPTILQEPVIVTQENYQEELIDSGYYTEADLDL